MTRKPFANARAEDMFVKSGLPDALAPVVAAEAHYVMSVAGLRYSDCVANACNYVVDAVERGSSALASPMARAMFDELSTDPA